MNCRKTVFVGGPWEGVEGPKFAMEVTSWSDLIMPPHPNSKDLNIEQLVTFLGKIEKKETIEHHHTYAFREINDEGNMVFVFVDPK